MIKQGKLRGEKIAYPDGIGYTIWYPFAYEGEDEESGICFDVDYEDIDDLIAHIDSLGYLPEGVPAAKHTRRLAEQLGISLPICQLVYRVLNRETDPLRVVDLILKRMA